MKRLLKVVIITMVVTATLFGCSSKEKMAVKAIKEMTEAGVLPEEFVDNYTFIFRNSTKESKEAGAERVLEIYEVFKDCKYTNGEVDTEKFYDKLSEMTGVDLDTITEEDIDNYMEKEDVIVDENTNNDTITDAPANGYNGAMPSIPEERHSLTEEDLFVRTEIGASDIVVGALRFNDELNGQYILPEDYKNYYLCKNCYNIVPKGEEEHFPCNSPEYSLDPKADLTEYLIELEDHINECIKMAESSLNNSPSYEYIVHCDICGAEYLVHGYPEKGDERVCDVCGNNKFLAELPNISTNTVYGECYIDVNGNCELITPVNEYEVLK